MSTDFGALDEFFEPGLRFTLKGKEYVVDPPSATVGLWCERMAEIAGGVRVAETEEQMRSVMARIEKLPRLDDDDLTLSQRTLGATHDQLVADGISHPWIKLLGQTAFIWIVSTEDAARRFIEAGGRPESQAPNRAARRASKASRATGGATATRKPASSSGTSSRKATTSPAASAKASRSRGPKS